jgi:mono/diheme cytochrome c family protein
MRTHGLIAVVVAGLCLLSIAVASGEATESPAQRGQACSRALERSASERPRLLPTPPPASLTSILETLRRAPTSADALPPGALPDERYSSLFVGYQRFLGEGPEQIRYFLIPGVVAPFPRVCIELLPPATRPAVLKRTQAQAGGSVTLEALTGSELLERVPYSAEDLESGDALYAIPLRHGSTTLISGVVPDGVASIVLTPSGGAPSRAPVVGNLFLASLPSREHAAAGVRVEWRAPDDSLIKGVRVPMLAVGPAPGRGISTALTLAPPAAVRRAGASAVGEFELGQALTARLGCLACHRIGGRGNAGPGPNLTEVGSRLPARAIEETLRHALAPMPSFNRLPPSELHAIVYFLARLHH